MEKNNIKILCVDDHRDNLISLKALIREAFPDAITLTAENGPDGIKLALSEDPNVILLDVVMPGMDGFEVCKKLKSNPKTSDIPVVFITALKGDKDSRIRALEVGAEAFLAKPIDGTELTAQIRAMVKIKAANSQKRFEKEVLAQRVSEQTRELEQAHAATMLLVEDLRKENEARKKNEVDLQNAKKFLEEAQRISHLGNWEWDLTTNQSTWSRELYQIYGRDQEMGTPSIDHWLENIHPDDRISLQNAIQSAMIAGNYKIDYRILRYDNAQIRWIHTEGEVAYEGKKPVSLHGVAQDITDRKQAEEAKYLSEERYRLLYESAGVGIAYYSPDGIVFSYNAIAARHMGGKPEDFAGKSILDQFPGPVGDFYMDRIRKAAASEGVQEYEDRVDLPGKTMWFVSAFSRILNSSNQVSGVQIISTDISQLKQAEEALRDREALLKKAQQVAHVGSWTWLIQQNRLAWSDEMYNIFGIKKENFDGILANVIANAIHPDDRAAVYESNRSVAEDGKPIPMEYRIVWPDGTVRVVWAEAGELTLDMDGKPDVLTGIVQDITERKLAEQKSNDQVIELRRWYSAMLGREKRTIELKKEVNELLAQAGQPPRYIEAQEAVHE
jgi:PAS domain S-box-containing protein